MCSEKYFDVNVEVAHFILEMCLGYWQDTIFVLQERAECPESSWCNFTVVYSEVNLTLFSRTFFPLKLLRITASFTYSAFAGSILSLLSYFQLRAQRLFSSEKLLPCWKVTIRFSPFSPVSWD